MKQFFYTLVILLSLSNCNLKSVVDHHGVHYLDKKEKKLILNRSNRNDVIKLLGPPVIQSTFDNDLFIYIEKKTSSTKLLKLGKREILTNNVLLLEIDRSGILVKKIFKDIDQMKKINFDKNETVLGFQKKKFIYEFLGGLRTKINDPLGKKRKKINPQ